MAALPGEDPEAHPRPKGAPATDGVAVEGCYCKATATAEGPSCSTIATPACCCGKSGEPSSPEALCYTKAPLLPAWLHADVAAAVASSCKDGTTTGKPFNWYTGAGASPAGAGGWRSPPMCCSTAVSPSSRCEQLSCCGSPASRWGECCCISGLQLQQLRCADSPTLQVAATSAGDSPLLLHATPLAVPAKAESEGPTITAQGPHQEAADAAAATEVRAAVITKEVATARSCSAADDGQNTTDTDRRGRASRRSSPLPVAAETSQDIAAVAVLPPPAAEASSTAAEASSAVAAAEDSTSSTSSFPSESDPKETQASYPAEAPVEPAAEPAAVPTAEAIAPTTEATPEGDTEGWISVKPRRQRRWADVQVSDDEADPQIHSTRKPPVSPPAASGRHQQRHSGAYPSRQRKPCSYGERSSTGPAAGHRQQHPQSSSCVFRAAVAAGLVAPNRDTFVAPTEQLQQKQQHPQQQQQQQQQMSPEDSRSPKGSSSSSNSSASSASHSRSWCLWHDACGNETNGSTKGSNNSKGRLQEEYERGLVQIGRSNSLKGIMQLWSLLTPRALGAPGNLAVAVAGCTPLWEDPQNRQGGHFAIRNLSGKGQAMELFFLLLRSLDQHHAHRNRRPLNALLSSLTGVVLCLRNNDRSHKVEVWVGSTAPQTVRQQEVQLRGVLSSLAAGPYRLDVGFLSHEVCLNKNQRKLRMKTQKKEPEDAASPAETSSQLQHPRQQLPTQEQPSLPQQQQEEQDGGMQPSFSPATDAAVAVGDTPAPASCLPSYLHDVAPSTCGSVSTDTGSSRRSSNRGSGCCNNGHCINGSMSSLFCDIRHSHPSYKSVILRGSSLKEQQKRGSSPSSLTVTPEAPRSSSCSGSCDDTPAKHRDEGRRTGQPDTAEPLHQRSRQQARQQQCRAGSNSSSKSPAVGPAAAPTGKSFAAATRGRDGMCIEDAADPAAAATAAPPPAGGMRGVKGGQKGGLALESGTRGKRMGRQKLQRRQYGGSGPSSAAVCPEQRLLQHLYAFDAREIPDYFSMQQAAYQGRASVYASYAACASAAVTAEPVAAAQQHQSEVLWDFPPLSSAATCGRYQSQKQHQRQPQLQSPCNGQEETANSITSCSLAKGEVAPTKSGKHFAFNPYAPGFVMPSRPLSAAGGDSPAVSGAAAAACSTIDGSSECSSAAAADICSELLLPAGAPPDVCSIPSAAVSSAEEEVQAAVAAAGAAAAAGYMGGFFDADFVDPRDPSSLLLITLMLHPALDDAAPLHVPLLPLTKLEGDAETADSQAASTNLADQQSPSGLSLTLDYEETTQTLSVDIVQS